jgi:hypothetical protein
VEMGQIKTAQQTEEMVLVQEPPQEAVVQEL